MGMKKGLIKKNEHSHRRAAAKLVNSALMTHASICLPVTHTHAHTNACTHTHTYICTHKQHTNCLCVATYLKCYGS